MAVIDKINRRGLSGKQVLAGPLELIGPLSNATMSDFSQLSGYYGQSDQYLISDGAGTNAGAYTVTVGPYSENGLRATLRSVGRISVLRQIGGNADPTAAITCLGASKVTRDNQTITLGPYTALDGDRMWIVVERTDQSTLKYQLALDFAA